MERVKGIEPSFQAWEAHVLPLNHTRRQSLFPRCAVVSAEGKKATASEVAEWDFLFFGCWRQELCTLIAFA
jgi:hypothetical protein